MTAQDHQQSKKKLTLHVLCFGLHRVLTLAFPVILLPLLAHRLAPDALGSFFIFQAWSGIFTLLIDFGFTSLGTRQMTHHDGTVRSDMISRIMTAQLLITIILLPLWLIITPLLPILQDHGIHNLWIILLAGAAAMTPNWYFAGRERMGLFILLDGILRFGVLAVVYFAPYADQDFIAPYQWITLGQGVTCAFALLLLMRSETLRLAPLREAIDTLRGNWRLCLSDICFSVSASLNIIFLSLFAAPVVIAAYGVAEKIIRGCFALSAAFTQALYPHFTRLQQDTAISARRLLLWGIGSNGIWTLAALLGIWLFAPFIMPYLAKGDPALALTLTYWQIPALFLFGVQGTVYMHGLLARRHDSAALAALLFGVGIYMICGTIAVVMQSILGVIIAQTLNFAGMIGFALWQLAQKKTPAPF